jgi:uncharacterized membrane protein YphA (DoxX/SURF4 family)
MSSSITHTSTVGAPTRGRAAKAALWAAATLLALLFASSALPKLTGAQLADFTRWGYPAWFMTAVGALELASAVAILVPRLALIGAAGMSAVLLGALLTIATHMGADSARLPLTLGALALAIFVGALRRRDLLAGRLAR